MPRGVGRYAAILRHGPASRPFAASIVARLPISMAPLGMLLLVRQVQGSYGYAGAVAGAFAAGTAVGGPWWGARVDRVGQTRVMLATSLGSASMLAAVAALAVASGPPALLLLVAAAAGLAFPPIGPGMRATWLATLPDRPRRQVAFALDAAAVESLFVGGPLLLSLLLVVSPPVVPLLVTAGLLAGGGTAYSLAGAVRSQVARKSVRSSAPRRRGWLPFVLRTDGVPAVLLVTAAFSLGFGHIDTSLAATARQVLHHPDRIGLLFTAIAGGSAAGGLVYGALVPSQSEHRRLPVTLAVLAVGLTPLPFLLAFAHPRLWWLMALLFLAGLAIAPSVIICQNLIENLTSSDQVSEVQAWLSTAGTAGQAAGTALAGVVVDRLGVSWSFAAAAAAVLLGSVVSGAYRNRWAVTG